MRTDDLSEQERRLSDMLHRVTPEPPRRMSVEDIAIRLANQAGPSRPARAQRAPQTPRGPHAPRAAGSGFRRFSPLMAAAAVVVVVGGSAGIAVSLSSHHSSPPVGGGLSSSSATPASGPATASGGNTGPANVDNSPSWQATGQPSMPPTPISGGPWSAEQIASSKLANGSLTGSGDALFAIAQDFLLEFDARNGNIVNSAAYNAPIDNHPVVAGGRVWVVTSYGGGLTVQGFSVSSLAAGPQVSIPVSGSLASQPQGILAAAPDGTLYVAAGNSVVAVDPVSCTVTRTIAVHGPVSSIAVSPDGSRLYAGSDSSGSFRLTAYSTSGGGQLSSSSAGYNTGGNLVATSGGVWGTLGFAIAERAWYAPGGDLSQMQLVSPPGSGAQDAAPTVTGGVVWLGGTRTLQCRSASTGSLLASTSIAADNGVPRHFGSLSTADGGHIYATYEDDRGHYAGIAVLSPPAACAS